ncbi:MAG: flippase-like domain-containing protein [Nitrospirae bacterium]|nr:flippase-like domain-containing protein [Nitrospirota bacterium]
MKNKKIIFHMVGLLLMVFILSRMNWHYLWISFRLIEVKYFLLAIPLCLFCIWLRTLRWFFIIRIQGIELSHLKAFVYYASSFFWSLVTPGRVGLLSRVFYLKEHNVSTGKAMFNVVIESFFDTFCLLLLSFAGTMLITSYISFPVVMSVSVISLSLLVVFRQRIIILQRLKKIILLLSPERYKDKIDELLTEAEVDLPLFSVWKVIALSILTIITWIIFYTPLFFFGSALDINVSPLFLFVGMVLSSLVSMLPVSIGGIGTRDGFLILYLAQAGVPKEKALIFSFMFIYIILILIVENYLIYMLKNSKTVNPEDGWKKPEGI